MAKLTKLACSCGATLRLKASGPCLPDTDTLECEICGETLKSWQQSRVHLFATLVRAKGRTAYFLRSSLVVSVNETECPLGTYKPAQCPLYPETGHQRL